MSGGHFDYKESYLGYIAEQLEQDIENNDVEYEDSKPYDTPYGYQHTAETMKFMKIMVDELYKLKEILREYDYPVSGDTSEEDFLDSARVTVREYRGETMLKRLRIHNFKGWRDTGTIRMVHWQEFLPRFRRGNLLKHFTLKLGVA
ncbi:MAG: hypothetical protein FDX02_09225 [Chlorobium sp.]|nr:MAG: hypothetical protein FDX02_09225 [Chlorobium sp.]